MKQVLIVFAKPPIAGLAKTRLIPALGKEGAAQYHEKLLHHTLKNVISAGEWDTVLWCSEVINHPFFEECRNQFDITTREQVSGDLGQRMAYAIKQMLTQYQKVCIVGSDCPVLNQEKIKVAFSSLKTKEDIVITPAEDGGYVLLAINKKLEPMLFFEIPWGTSSVFSKTLDRIKSLKSNAIIQPTLWDIDEPTDLSRIVL